jgi:hypothetical protein
MQARHTSVVGPLAGLESEGVVLRMIHPEIGIEALDLRVRNICAERNNDHPKPNPKSPTNKQKKLKN